MTINGFSINNAFDAVSHINNLPRKLFDDGYRFVSFYIKSLFTNVPLKKIVDIILNRIYKSKLISTTLTKCTLKLILDSCTKTVLSLNGEYYEQIDGVSMGSPLGPALANIIMTEFETVMVKPLINPRKIVFYKCYVDDTLVLAKPSDIEHILNTFNTFDSQIQFTFPRHSNTSEWYHCPPQTNPYWSIPTLVKLYSMVEKDFLDTCPHSLCPQNLKQ